MSSKYSKVLQLSFFPYGLYLSYFQLRIDSGMSEEPIEKIIIVCSIFI